jgi:hypothetical protein
MRSNKGGSLVRLTASCEVLVRQVGRAGGYVALEIAQGEAGEKVTTLLLCPTRARELASLLLSHSGGVRAEGFGAETGRGAAEEVGAARAS